MGNRPDMRAIVKVGEKQWDSIGVGWKNNEKISVSLDKAPIVSENGKIKFLLVPNNPKRTPVAPSNGAPAEERQEVPIIAIGKQKTL